MVWRRVCAVRGERALIVFLIIPVAHHANDGHQADGYVVVVWRTAIRPVAGRLGRVCVKQRHRAVA